MNYENFVKTIFEEMSHVIIYDEHNHKVAHDQLHKLIDNPTTEMPDFTLFYDVKAANIKMLSIDKLPNENLIALPYHSSYIAKYHDKLDLLAENFVRQGSAHVLHRNDYFEEKLQKSYVANFVNLKADNLMQMR